MKNSNPLTSDERIILSGEILESPSKFHLIDILKEIKYGRPANNQKLIDKWILELKNSCS